MLKTGITGGIGSGKSTISSIFELLGIAIYNSDIEAKKILNENTSVKKNVIEIFGKNILLSNDIIDRKAIATIVFNDKTMLQKLNAIIHPAIALHFNNWLTQQNSKYILKEAAILFESGANKLVDKTIVVTAPKELKIERILKRDKTTKAEIEQRIKNQMQDDDLIKLADYVIVNDETQSVIQQVLKIHNELLAI